MQCNQCKRFSRICKHVFKHREELRSIYEKLLKDKPMRRRAFIVRSHGVRDSSLRHWLITELQELQRRTDPPKVLHKDTTADMNAVATVTQEHPHCHLVRYAIPRGTISPPM